MSKKITLKKLGENFYETRTERDFKKLYDRIYEGLYLHIKKIVKDDDITKDVLSETMTKVYNKIDTFNSMWNISTWIYKIGYNEACGYLRQERRRQTYSLDSYLDNMDNTEIAMDKLLLLNSMHSTIENYQELMESLNKENYVYDMLEKEINNLKDEFKLPLKMHYIEDVKYKDIADILNIPMHTVKNRIYHGKKILNEQLKSIV